MEPSPQPPMSSSCTHDSCTIAMHPDLRARVVAANGVRVQASCGATLRLSELPPLKRKRVLDDLPPPILNVVFAFEPDLKPK
jgi:hypothetical protein